MPKIKTNSGAKKRFKLSKNGKPIRGHAFKSHILNKKTTKRKRNLRKDPILSKIKINCNLFEDESSDWEAMNA